MFKRLLEQLRTSFDNVRLAIGFTFVSIADWLGGAPLAEAASQELFRQGLIEWERIVREELRTNVVRSDAAGRILITFANSVRSRLDQANASLFVVAEVEKRIFEDLTAALLQIGQESLQQGKKRRKGVWQSQNGQRNRMNVRIPHE